MPILHFIFNCNQLLTAYYNIHSSRFGGGEIRAFATPVPWETDALSVVGTTLLFGFGIWRKNKVSQRNLK
jgi:hypothetical protein